MALPTPPNSGKVQTEHSFDDHHQHHDDGDVALFEKEAGCASPTDAVLFPKRLAQTVPASPSSPALTSPPLKRRKTEENETISPPRWHPINEASLQDSPKKEMVESKIEPAPSSPRREEALGPVKDESTRVQKKQRQREVSPPAPEDIELFNSFVDAFSNRFIDDGRELWFTMRHVRKDSPSNRWLVPHISKLSVNEKPKAQKAARPKKASRSIMQSVEGANRPTTPTKSPHSNSNHARRRSSTAAPNQQPKAEARSTRNPANKPLVSKNYQDWPDYAPPPSTMIEPEKIARNIPPMSGRKDLSNDPLQHELHPAELIAAHQAGMDCARYLCTKRSVFVGYVKHLRYMAGKYQLTPDDQKKGLKSWNKTAAQGCSAIDVNKTSILWGHFWSQIGWFNKDLYKDLIEADHVYFPEFDKEGNVKQ